MTCFFLILINFSGGYACRLQSPFAYICNPTELYVKSKIEKIIHRYGDTILVDFNVSNFDIFAISHTLNLILMSGFDNI